MEATLQALEHLRTDLNEILKVEKLYPPDNAERCEYSEEFEVASWINLDAVEKMPQNSMPSILRIGFIENFKHNMQLEADRFYRFEKFKMELSEDPILFKFGWKISAHVVPYYLKEKNYENLAGNN